MQFARYVDNRVLGACIRPQLPKWCGPTTVAEILQVLLGKTICPHEVAEIMQWNVESIVGGGLGTTSIRRAIQKCSNYSLDSEIMRCDSAMELWHRIQEAMARDEIIYMHEPGHHVLLLGYLEEPVITPELFNQGMACATTMQKKSGTCPLKSTSSSIRRLLLKAEHNIRKPEINGIGRIIVEKELVDVFKELKLHPERLHAVRVYKV